MARLTIEIDTGVINKVERLTSDRLTALINLVEEAAYRLEKMGRGVNGTVLYGPNGPAGRITLVESDKRKGEPRNWYDDTVHAGVPLSERRDESEPEPNRATGPAARLPGLRHDEKPIGSTLVEEPRKLMRSKFRGKCTECRGVIDEGAWIEYLSGSGAWH